MRKFNVFVLFFLLATLCTNAQITIQSGDLNSAGDAMQIQNAVLMPGVTIDPEIETGADYVWDFSEVETISTTVNVYTSLTEVPEAFQYYFDNELLFPNHNSTHALQSELPDLTGEELPVTVSDAHEFFINSETQFAHVGYAALLSGFPLAIQRQPLDILYNFPINYNDEDTSYSSFFTEIPFIGAIGQDQYRYNKVDGWGEITTPFGTFDALRIRSVLHITDTLNIPEYAAVGRFERPETIEYKWLSPGAKVPVFKIITIEGQIATMSYMGEEVTVGLDSKFKSEIPEVYPNPAGDYLDISNINAENLELFNVNGKKISVSVEGNKLNTTGLSSGVYFIKTKEKDRLKIIKFMVQR